MTWFKVDDSFYDHPKVFDAPDCAVALWVRAGTWSARNLTDGFVPAGLPVRLCDDHDTAVRELVRRGLWSRKRDGYQFHDWPEYQPTAGEVRELRAKRADAGRKGGEAKAAKQNSSNDLANASGVAKQNAAPTRPVPSPSSGNPPGSTSRVVGGAGGKPRERGTRIPDDFHVTEAMVEWAREHVPEVDGRRETEKFINHWRAKAGRDATKLDWKATWRNWMLKAADYAPGPRASPNGQPRPSTRDRAVADALAAGARVQAQLDQQQRLEITA